MKRGRLRPLDDLARPHSLPGRFVGSSRGIRAVYWTMTDTGLPVVTHWIDGAAAVSSSGRTAPVDNPATGAAQANVALADEADIGAAIASTRQRPRTRRASPSAISTTRMPRP